MVSRIAFKLDLMTRTNGHARTCNCPNCRDTELDGTPKWYRHLLKQAQRNAQRRGIAFELTSQEFRQIADRCAGHCEVSGVPFDISPPVNGKRRPFAPSLDRIESSRGYSFANCRMVSVMINLALNEWGIEPLLQVAHHLVERERQLLFGNPVPEGWQTIRSFCAERNLSLNRHEWAAFQSRCQGLRRQRGLSDRWVPSGTPKERLSRSYPKDLLLEAFSKSHIRVA